MSPASCAVSFPLSYTSAFSLIVTSFSKFIVHTNVLLKCRFWGSGGGMNWEIGIDIYTLICIK